MNIEDIKVGETYYVRVKVLHKNETIIGCATVDKEGKNLVEFMAKEGPAFIPIPHPAQKYDPCRKFRKGDKVRPVEELEPYSSDHNQYGWHVEKNGEILATYNDERHPHAKAAAEAERDRLNAEWRKEQE